KFAVLSNAASIILGHNHPSGDPSPSIDDIRTTKRLVDAGKILGIEVLDHIIVGEEGHTSLRNTNEDEIWH
ncbi:MAG: JAB domain-containing protein, partial [Dehalococcoidia bacterium]|nr:JAB domain-containing protein [Dehalococcoidia bacterium]